MKRLLAVTILLAGCQSGPATPAATSPTPTPKPTPNMSRPIKQELNDRLDKASTIFHAGCRDEEKASCKDPSRTCTKGIASAMKSAVAKKEIAVEWEAPRETWAKNEGVLDHYWFVNADGSGTYYYLLPSPDDIQTDCGNGEYCGWHREAVTKAGLFSAGKFALTTHGGAPIADLDFCRPAPPQN